MGSVLEARGAGEGIVFCTYSSDITFLPAGSLDPFLLSGTGKQILQISDFKTKFKQTPLKNTD